MYNRLVCGLSGQTIQAGERNSEITIIFNGASTGSEVGKVVTPFPFVMNFNFKSNLEPSTKKDAKEFRRFVYHLLSNYKLKIKELHSGEETKYSYGFKQRPSKEDVEKVGKQILSFPNDEYEIFFSYKSIEFSLAPFIATKKQFEIIKHNDFSINFNFSKKEDLIKWSLEDRKVTRFLRKQNIEIEDNDVIKKMLFERAVKKNDTSFIKPNLLKESLFLSISAHKYIGLNGLGKKASESLEKMFDTYWMLYKLTEMNINMNLHSTAYPNTRINSDLIKYHEKRLEILKEELKDE